MLILISLEPEDPGQELLAVVFPKLPAAGGAAPPGHLVKAVQVVVRDFGF